MIEMGSGDLAALCADPGVSERLSAMESERQAAVRQFWLYALGGLAVAGAAAAFLYASGWATAALIAFLLLAFGAGIAAFLPLNAAKEGLKHPVLTELGRRAGLDYYPTDFDPPAFASARHLLFGRFGFSSETYTDLFNGKDEAGQGHAIYEACLQRRVGRNTVTVFSGQMYALRRRPGSAHGETVIVPDRSLFNFWKPSGEMERVPVEVDREFERRFEVYSSNEMEARALVFDSAFRARLLGLREEGKVWVYAGPSEALVAVAGSDRFEPGSMLRYRPGEDRVKLMFDDVCASLTLLGELKARLG